MKNALLFFTHTWSEELAGEFAKLSRVKGTEAWLLTDSRNAELQTLIKTYPRCHIFDVRTMDRLPYTRIETKGLRGHGHFPLLDFFLKHPDFENYWVVEYDVRYTGDWARLFARMGRSPEDMITAHIRWYREEPYWHWWDTFGHTEVEVPASECLRSFNVMYRISARALRFLDRELQTGWRGHHEVLLVTLLHLNGFTLRDLGGDGDFAPRRARNRVYRSSRSPDGSLSYAAGTLCYRPARTGPGSLKNKLYHPVKPEGDAGGFVEERQEQS